MKWSQHPKGAELSFVISTAKQFLLEMLHANSPVLPVKTKLKEYLKRSATIPVIGKMEKKNTEVAILFLSQAWDLMAGAGSLPEVPFWRGDMECTATTIQGAGNS